MSATNLFFSYTERFLSLDLLILQKDQCILLPTVYSETELSLFPVLFPLIHLHCKSATTRLTIVCFVFVALRPMSTAMVIAGRSVQLTTHFPGQA